MNKIVLTLPGLIIMAFLVVSAVVVDDDNRTTDSLNTVDAENATSSENENNSAMENEVPPIPRNIAILMLLGMIISTVLAYRYISRQ